MMGFETPVRRILRARGLSVADLTRMAGLRYARTWSAVAGYACSRDTAQLLADALGVELEEVYPGPFHDVPPDGILARQADPA